MTACAASIATTQAPLPEHAPDHPVNTDVGLGVAVSVTTVPSTKSAAQVAPHAIPAGSEVISVPPRNGEARTAGELRDGEPRLVDGDRARLEARLRARRTSRRTPSREPQQA